MRELKVIESYAEAKAVPPEETVLLKVPGEHARAIYWLVHTLSSPDRSEVGQLVRQLMASTTGAPQ